MNSKKTPESELEKLMKNLGVNQSQLGVSLGIGRGRMSDVMTGKSRLSLTGIREAVKLGADPIAMLEPFKYELTQK